MPLILDGTLTLDVNIQDGTLSDITNLNGEFGNYIQVSAQTYPYYEGEYEVIPMAYESQVLPTTDTIMRDDLTIREVPYYETSNVNGTTVYIASEV